ncbi:MAG TPA: AAA family ATPase [Spirochaetota bacterium]|nr:AAA family ATPase [Spirochaetota bacterium]
MYLKSMEIFGFKSFADRTPVTFEPGITVVVGPNGCGKSNIVDSAKWVLGEKQAKNIRGTRMEDIIFTGTEHRKPLSLAEVSLTLDNSTRLLNFDSESVTVTRRIFRDGESEYLINKSPVRLKDIEQLFMDTGIGKTSYSVMEQGRIDMILSSRAEDRRYLFEEAAGISRYKVQKRDSLKKLSDTSENLDRINDIIHEIDREKQNKAKQAEKTKEYIKFKSELKEFDLKLQALKYRDLHKRLSKIVENRDKLVEESKAISQKISGISEENERDEKRKNEIQLQLFELDKKMHTYRIKVEDIDDKREKNNKLIQENREQRERLLAEVEERRISYKNLTEEKARNQKNGSEIEQKIAEDRNQLKIFFERRKQKIEQIHNNRETIDKNRLFVTDSEKTLKSLRDELEVVIKQLIDAIDKRKAELLDSETERQSVRASIHEQVADIREKLSAAINAIEEGGDCCNLLSSIDIDKLNESISRFESFEDGFRSILFDKTGIHARKESIDKKIADCALRIEEARAQNISLEEQNVTLQGELEDVNEMITRIEKDLSRNDNERVWIEKHVQGLDRQIEDIEKHIKNVHTEIKRFEEKTEQLLAEIKDWEEKLVEFSERSVSLKKRIEESSHKREEIDKKIVSRKQSSARDAEKLNEVNTKISDLEKKSVEIEFKKNSAEEYIWTEYELKPESIKKVKVDELELEKINEQIGKLKKSIERLGPINNLAIEEYNDLKKRFDYYSEQRDDIMKAREDIISVIEDINQTSVRMFVETFEQIQKNFTEIFKQLFEGGHAEVILADPENVLESGIDITVRPPGKKPKTINLLSGGERSMTAIALLFSTYMVKPSPFCFLDEIDAALDEENVRRFLKMMRQFSQKTQFIIVTHNKKTMTIGSSIYGVTMEEPGVSKLVSMRLGSDNSSNLA